ncbi:protein artemis [Trichonephila clavipes]|nr:protein artemis [Trichonephila clavipes]
MLAHSSNIKKLAFTGYSMSGDIGPAAINGLSTWFITHPQLQADMFADYFASKNAYHEPLPLDFLYDKNNLNKPFHILELHSAIKNSKNTTPGADHITAIFFKNLDQDHMKGLKDFGFFQLLKSRCFSKIYLSDVSEHIIKNDDALSHLSEYLVKVRYIKPCAMSFKNLIPGDNIYVYVEKEKIYKVCFSTHSSLSEVRDLVHYLKPKNIYPNVVHNQTVEEILDLINAASPQDSSSLDLNFETPLGILKRTLSIVMTSGKSNHAYCSGQGTRNDCQLIQKEVPPFLQLYRLE